MITALKLKRRGFLLGSGMAFAAPALLLAEELDSFKVVAPPRLPIGTIFRDNPYEQPYDLIKFHCNTFTCENALKTNTLTEGGVCADGRLNTADYDRLREFLRERNDLDWRHNAHAFYWPTYPWPLCFRSDPDRFAALYARLIAGAVSCDVLNEVFKKTETFSAFGDENHLEALRDQGFDPLDLDDPDRRAEALGYLLHEDIPGTTGEGNVRFLAEVVIALRKALKAIGSGHTRLVINEDELASGTQSSALKRKALLALARELATRAKWSEDGDVITAKVDVIGMQSHLFGKPELHPDPDALRLWMQDVGTDFDVHISELDVKYKHWEGGAYTEDAHAELISGFLKTVLPFRHVTRLSFWGLRDDLHSMQRHDAMIKAKPHFYGAHARPTLFRPDNTPKKAAEKVAEVLKALDR